MPSHFLEVPSLPGVVHAWRRSTPSPWRAFMDINIHSLACLSCFVFLCYCWDLCSTVHFFLLRFTVLSGSAAILKGCFLWGRAALNLHLHKFRCLGRVWYLTCISTEWDKDRVSGVVYIVVSGTGTRTTYFVCTQLDVALSWENQRKRATDMLMRHADTSSAAVSSAEQIN